MVREAIEKSVSGESLSEKEMMEDIEEIIKQGCASTNGSILGMIENEGPKHR